MIFLVLKTVCCIVAAIAGLTIIISMFKSKHFIKAIFMTAIQGIIALFAVNITGLITGVVTAINWYTIGISVIGGTPGVVMLLLMNVVLKNF